MYTRGLYSQPVKLLSAYDISRSWPVPMVCTPITTSRYNQKRILLMGQETRWL